MIAERDEKIRELEETVKLLKEKLSVCDTATTEEETNIDIQEEIGDTFVTIEHEDQ